MTRKILVTGASIAGSTVAWWLSRFGMEVTVVERAPDFRDGGQNVDVRGAARTVLKAMELEEAVLALGTGEQGVAFVDEDDQVHASFGVRDFGGNGPTAEAEILRGDLAKLLYDSVKERAAFKFGDSVRALADRDNSVDVTFASGATERFDLVIVAEGIASSTRRLLFGDEAKREPLGLYMAYFTIPRRKQDGAFARWYNAPGARSVVLRPDCHGTTRALLTVREAPHGYESLSCDEQKAYLRATFADAGWETPRVLAGLKNAKDFYFEAIGQVKLSRWSSGRSVLVGDAAWCPSPITGMGTSLALVGAYVLAGELCRHQSTAEALEAYERVMRPYVEQAQRVHKIGRHIALPETHLGIYFQRAAFAIASKPSVRRFTGKLFSPPAERISLPAYH